MNYRSFGAMAAMAMMFAEMGALAFPEQKDCLEGIDIKAEYEKIKQKKSGLSRSMRERVIRRYEAESKKQ